MAGLAAPCNPVVEARIKRIFAAEGSRKGFRRVHHAIRGNHLHLICDADHARTLSRGIQRIGTRIARQLNRRFRNQGRRFFADRFHGNVIGPPKQTRNALRYV